MLLPTLVALLGTLILVLRIVLALRSRDAPGNRTVAVAFAPPRALSPGTGAQLRREVLDQTAVPAEILDLAVKGIWKVGVREADDGRRTWFVQRDSVHAPLLDGVGWEVYRAVFPYGSTALTQDLTRDPHRARAYRDVVRKAAAEARNLGLLGVRTNGTSLDLATSLGVAAVVAGGVVWFVSNGGAPPPEDPAGWALVGGGVLPGLASAFFPVRRRWLTVEGRRLNDELDGLKQYMTMAEADRLKVLQAPDTALRLPARVDRPGGGVDRARVAKLHERLLPWAVVFGILPEWSSVLSADLREAGIAPEWMYVPGADGFAGAITFDAFTQSGGLDTLGDLGSFADAGSDGAGLVEIGPGSGGSADGGSFFGGWDGGFGGDFGGGGDGGGGGGGD